MGLRNSFVRKLSLGGGLNLPLSNGWPIPSKLSNISSVRLRELLQMEPARLWRRARPKMQVTDDRLDLAAVLGSRIAGLVRSAEYDSALMAPKLLSKARAVAESASARSSFQSQSRRSSDRLAGNLHSRSCCSSRHRRRAPFVRRRIRGDDKSSVECVRGLRAGIARHVGNAERHHLRSANVRRGRWQDS